MNSIFSIYEKAKKVKICPKGYQIRKYIIYDINFNLIDTFILANSSDCKKFVRIDKSNESLKIESISFILKLTGDLYYSVFYSPIIQGLCTLNQKDNLSTSKNFHIFHNSKLCSDFREIICQSYLLLEKL